MTESITDDIKLTDIHLRILREAVWPNVKMGLALVFINWAAVGVYFNLYWSDIGISKIIILCVYALVIPTTAYGLWILRRALLRGFDIIYDGVFRPLLVPILSELVDRVLQEKTQDTENESPWSSFNYTELTQELERRLEQRLSSIPKWLRRAMLFLVKKIGTLQDSHPRPSTGLESKSQTNTPQREGWLVQQLEGTIASALQGHIALLLPVWIWLLIPFNIIIMIAIFCF